MRARVGSVVRRKGRGKNAKPTWWARITYTDPMTGKRHDRQRRAENKIHAGELVHQLLAEIDSTGGRSLSKEHISRPVPRGALSEGMGKSGTRCD
jgi:hypothetical protein